MSNNLSAARAKHLTQLARRGVRHSRREFLAEGPQAVREALRAPGDVLEMYVDDAARHADLLTAARDGGVPVHEVTGRELAKLSDTVTPQGVLARCRFRDVSLDTLAAGDPRLVAVLAAVRDPGNAGTVLRVADAAGADAVVFADDAVDPYNGKTVRASAGSLWHVPFALDVPSRAAVDALRSRGLRVLAAAGDGADTDLFTMADAGGLAGPVAWLFGNEAWGLPADVRALADEVVAVPLYGAAESLNLATAAAVCLYTTARAQRVVGGCQEARGRARS